MPDPLGAGAVITRHSLNWTVMDAVYEAAVQAVDESVINAIVQGEDTVCVKPEGAICPGLDTAELCRIMADHGRLR